MAHPILMPKPGQMTEECTLVAWHKTEGDAVKKGDLLFEIETDKSNMDVEAFEEGVLLKRLVQEGETVPVNAVCAYVGEPGEAIPAASAVAGAVTPAPRPAGAPAPVVQAPVVQAPVAWATTVGTVLAAPAPQAASEGRLRISPRASRLAAELGLDPRTITGSGPEGRITERDVKAAAEVAGPSVASSAGAGAAGTDEGASVSPRAGRLASAAGIDPLAIAGTGRGGRIVERDVRTALGTSAGRVAPGPDVIEEPEAEPRPLSRMRRIIAERLTLSATTVPQFTVTVSVDMTALVALRNELKATGTALTVTDFIAWATAQSLVDFPDVNSRTDGASVWPRRRVHLGIAVALPSGLVVPVVRDADRRSVTDLHTRTAGLAEAARDGTLSPDDMTGSTFTISNLGMLGVDEFQAIINPGEAAILAVSSVVPTPVAIGDAIAVRQMMKLTLTSDHRLVDGELAARFVNAIRRKLQDADGLRAAVQNG
jgi:pyruvate dehydrogenase E2 component (dihydrolipoamide acetyltransferase)